MCGVQAGCVGCRQGVGEVGGMRGMRVNYGQYCAVPSPAGVCEDWRGQVTKGAHWQE